MFPLGRALVLYAGRLIRSSAAVISLIKPELAKPADLERFLIPAQTKSTSCAYPTARRDDERLLCLFSVSIGSRQRCLLLCASAFNWTPFSFLRIAGREISNVKDAGTPATSCAQ